MFQVIAAATWLIDRERTLAQNLPQSPNWEFKSLIPRPFDQLDDIDGWIISEYKSGLGNVIKQYFSSSHCASVIG